MIAVDRKMLESAVRSEEAERDQAAQQDNVRLAVYHDGRATALQAVLDGEYGPMSGREVIGAAH